jgi:hypothetical protein
MPTTAETPAPKPRGRPPGTTKLAMAMRHPGANLPIDHPLNQEPPPAPRRGPGRPRGAITKAPPPRRGPGRPKGVTKAVMAARRAETAANPPPVVRKDGRGGARPGAGRPRKVLKTDGRNTD